MARASQVVSDQVAIPHEPGHWMRFRLIPFTVLQEARAAKLKENLALAKLFDGVKVDQEQAKAEATAAAEADPTAPYDRATLLCAGIHSWSYEGAVDGKDLDERTSKWAAREIIARAIPSEDDMGKGSSRSTGTSATPGATPESPTS